MVARPVLRRRRSRAGPTLLWLPLLVISSLAASGQLVGRKPLDTARQAPLAELWIEPADLEQRDLFWGPGGRALAPPGDAEYKLIESDHRGHSPGYRVEGPDGRHWKVKIGDEAQPEIVVSRFLWAIGYHQPPMYWLPEWRLSGGAGVPNAPGRFRLESGFKKPAEWSWERNPFVGTRQLRGLLVANLVFNNWDLSASNNRLYELKQRQDGVTEWYVVQDVGAALGKSLFPLGSRNKVEDFESQDLITGASGGRPRFGYYSIHSHLTRDVEAADVVWVCRLLSRLSQRQRADAFRAAGYPDEVAARYLRMLDRKLRQGLELETAAGGGR